MFVLLDSTVLIDYLRGRPVATRVQRLRRIDDVPATTGINVEEVVRGLESGELDAAQRLFDGLEVISIGARDGWLAGSWRRQFAAQGVTLWQADCLIAAVASRVGARLATGNPKDFPMPEITVEHWPTGA
ncbi:MAG: PIN domain-containing protein [Egibacteraceae bacterium]